MKNSDSKIADEIGLFEMVEIWRTKGALENDVRTYSTVKFCTSSKFNGAIRDSRGGEGEGDEGREMRG